MKKVLFLVGPTASGKSEIALPLARALGAEIVSADSMQVYRGMNIGTAKPSEKELREVPHHLIDIADPAENYSVYDYWKQARAVMSEITERGKTVLVVGGTGLYVKALIEGLSEQPEANESFRLEMEELAANQGLNVLAERLRAIDSEFAENIDLKNPRRVIRALELYYVTGRKPSEFRGSGEALESAGYRAVLCGIDWEREELYERINVRVDQMMKCGLLAEVKALAASELSRTARQAVGYKELLDVLDESGTAGEEDLVKAVEQIKTHSRRLAKRQLTWFRADAAIRWFRRSHDDSVDSLVSGILSCWQSA